MKATVTLADGRKVEVEVPADAADATKAAIAAAAKELGVTSFAQRPKVEHHRDEKRPE